MRSANWASSAVFALDDNGDEILLLDGSDTVLDVVTYEGNMWPGLSNTNLTAATGQSLERAPADRDTNDIARDFVVRPDDGTPVRAVRRVIDASPIPITHNAPISSTLAITLNGTVILEGNLKEASRNGTADGKDHPGLKRSSGHIGFLGHGSLLWFRNIRIREL